MARPDRYRWLHTGSLPMAPHMDNSREMLYNIERLCLSGDISPACHSHTGRHNFINSASESADRKRGKYFVCRNHQYGQQSPLQLHPDHPSSGRGHLVFHPHTLCPVPYVYRIAPRCGPAGQRQKRTFVLPGAHGIHSLQSRDRQYRRDLDRDLPRGTRSCILDVADRPSRARSPRSTSTGQRTAVLTAVPPTTSRQRSKSTGSAYCSPSRLS